MSIQPSYEPACSQHRGTIELIVEPRIRSLGELDVRRVLPAAERRMVGPFIFFDHMGPAVFPPGAGIAVRPHPHIALATVTYLFEGEIVHRDSLGCVQPIRPGALNLMTAGRGIVHSERAGEDFAVTSRLHGIQSWTALPAALEECDPSFVHHSADALPELETGGNTVRVLLGSAFGRTSPAVVASPTLYLEVRMPLDARFDLPNEHTERAVYVVSGRVEIDGQAYGEGVMAIARPGADVAVQAAEPSLLMIIGGEPVGARHIWWNFVATSKERIERAKQDWRDGRFPKVPGDDEFIPLPTS